MLVALLAGIGYGVAAVLTVPVPPFLGHGHQDVPPDTSITAVKWVVGTNDPTRLVEVELTSSKVYKALSEVHIRVDTGGSWETFELDALDQWVVGPGAQVFDIADHDVADVDEINIVINEAP